MADERPTWQVDDCPPWCAGRHLENDHPDDRVHRSAGTTVPVIARRQYLGDEWVEYSVQDVDFEVGASRVDGESATWIYVGSGPAQSIEVTPDGASRLLREAGAALDRVTGRRRWPRSRLPS